MPSFSPHHHVQIIVLDWEKTSLKPYVEILDKHALGLMEQLRRDRRGTGSYFVLRTPASLTFAFWVDLSW